MKCTRCGELISEDEVLCENCKKILKKESSKNEVRELEEEIENNKLLNEDEDTKELFDIETLNEELEKENEETKEEIIPVEETRVEKYRGKKNNKKIIIIISSIVVLLIVILIILLLVNKKEPKEEVKLNYQKLITMYGKKVEKELSTYEELPEWEDLIKNIEFDYEVKCNTHEIYNDKKVYLDKCTIDKTKIKYSYGKKQEAELKTTINVYKDNYRYNTSEGDLVGTITCEDSKCEFITGFDNYAIIKENNSYNLYEYNKEKVLGPFSDMKNILYIENTLYGVYYTEGNTKYLYSLVSNKLYDNLSGTLLLEEENFDPTLMYKYGYAILKNNGYNFVNLKNGKVSYSISDKILKFEEDKSNDIMYILTYKNDASKFSVINSNGKKLFDGELNYFKLNEDEIIVGNDTSFKVYDKKLNIKVSSKEYNSVINIYDDYAIVMDNSIIKLVDLNDNILSQFDLEIKNEIDKEKTGWNTIDGKTGIFIVFKGTDTKLYYDSKTGEMELIQKND